jgi:hypothetical protein
MSDPDSFFQDQNKTNEEKLLCALSVAVPYFYFLQSTIVNHKSSIQLSPITHNNFTHYARCDPLSAYNDWTLAKG